MVFSRNSSCAASLQGNKCCPAVYSDVEEKINKFLAVNSVTLAEFSSSHSSSIKSVTSNALRWDSGPAVFSAFHRVGVPLWLT